ncbi:MAG TPA: hypothetical protein VKE30_00765 [Chthoniobacterales bacterium]|nr:hypothetical protein [Chthoniobacterales bacterium]
MTKKFICFLAAMIAARAVTVLAEEKPADGSLTLSKKTWQLSQGVAYETTADGEDALVVVLSNQPITAQKLKEARAAEKKGDFPDFKKPYLKLVFNKNGELKQWNGVDNNTSVSGVPDEGAKAELNIRDGRAIGKASHPLDPSATIPRSLDVKFNVAMLKANKELPASASIAKKSGGPAANVKPTVSGTFTGNGKDAKLNYVSARWTEPFDNKPGILLLFTERDHSKDKKPDNDAMFGKYGNALIISLHEDGSIYSCQVVHNAMKNKGFSSSGSIEATPFTYENGKVDGEITTNGVVDTFDEKWEVKLKFLAPLGEIPKEYQVAEERPAAKESKASSSETDEDTTASKSNEKPGPKAKDLALTKDASEINYSGLVGQIDFKSRLAVKAACADLSANLKKQGWAKDGDDLITPASSILSRKKGSAKLTIFVKPAGSGSQIKAMTEGLTWEEE